MPDDLRKGGLKSQARVQARHRPGTKQSLPLSSPPPPIKCFYTLNQNTFYTRYGLKKSITAALNSQFAHYKLFKGIMFS